MWLAMIVAHAIAGVLSFVLGGLALIPSERLERRSWLFPAYLAALIGMVVFMGGAIASDWRHIPQVRRFVYAGLLALGVYMLARAFQARSEERRRGAKWQERYIGHVGFTLISLFDGFAIVTAIDLHAAGWLVGAVATLGMVAGIWFVNRAKKRALVPGR